MSSDLQLLIRGKDAEKLGTALQEQLQTQSSEPISFKAQTSTESKPDDKSIEALGLVLGISSFIMSVPGFFLAMASIIDRLNNKDKVETLTQLVTELQKDHDADVLVRIDNKLYQLTPVNVEAIHEEMTKQEQA